MTEIELYLHGDISVNVKAMYNFFAIQSALHIYVTYVPFRGIKYT